MSADHRDDIRVELESLERLVLELAGVTQESSADRTRTRAAGSILHDYYCGLEKIFTRIARQTGENLPEGPRWHTDLLESMREEQTGKRPAVIEESLGNALKELLTFRHLFRNIYGFDLRWDRVAPLSESLPATHSKVTAAINAFIRAIEG